MKTEEPKSKKPVTGMELPDERPPVQQDLPPGQSRKVNVIGLVSLIALFLLITGVVLLASLSKNEKGERHTTQQKTDVTQGKRVPLKNAVPGRVVVKRKPGVPAATGNTAVVRKLKAKIRLDLPQTRTQIFDVPIGQEDALIAELRADPMIEYVGRVAFAHSTFTPNDTAFDQQYGLQTIQAPTAWDITKGKGVKVGIVDTGIDLNHVDLQEKVAAGKDFMSNGDPDASVQDKNGHGTHVAGIISAATNNAKGVAGGCPDCKLIIAKALDGSPGSVARGTTDVISEAIIWATDQGAKVINTSLSVEENGNFTCEAYKELKDAIDYAFDKGVVVVAAAGNDGNASPHFPAAFENVISVANTDKNDQKYQTSNYGADWVDIAAPGTDILSTVISQKAYDFMTGTSMASPHVAAVAALLWANGAKSNSGVIDRLQASSDNIKGTGNNWKYGRVNAANAVGGKDQDGKEPPPSAEPTKDPNAEQQSKRKPKVAAIDPTQPCGDEPPGGEPTKDPDTGGPKDPTPGDGTKKEPTPTGDDGKNPPTTPGTGQPLATPTFVCLASPNCGLTGTPPPDVFLTLTPGGPGTPPPGTPDWLTLLQQRLAEMRRRLQEAADELRQRMEDVRNRLLQTGEQVRERTGSPNAPAQPIITPSNPTRPPLGT